MARAQRLAAKASEWARIRGSQELQQGIREIRRRFNIPPGLRFINQIKLVDSPDFLLMVSNLRDDCQVPADFPLIAEIFNSPAKIESYDPGLPIIRGGSNLPTIIDATNADLTDPEVIGFIQKWQKLHDDPPPQPAMMTGKNHGKKDWRPVWEWAARHPLVTKKELASLLNYNYDYLKKKLASLDPENSTM